MKATYLNTRRCSYVEAYPLTDERWGGRMVNLDSRESFSWFKGHEPLYCLGTNGNGIELFFDLGGASVSGAIYERVMTGRNVEVLKAMPSVVRDTFFMACDIFPPLCNVVLQLKSEEEAPVLKNTLGFFVDDVDIGFCIVMDQAITDIDLLVEKVRRIREIRSGSFTLFEGLFKGVPERLFENFPEFFVAMVFAHELGHIMHIIRDYGYDIDRFDRDRDALHLREMGYRDPTKAVEAGVRGEKLLQIERMYRKSPFESIPDQFALEIFTKNINYFSGYMRNKTSNK